MGVTTAGTSRANTRESRIEEILQAARTLFSDKGYEQTSMAEIANKVGVVEGTLYKYFESKRELLLAVLSHWYEGMFGDYAEDLRGIHGTRARLQFLVWRHLRTLRDNPDFCRLTFNEFRVEKDYHGSKLQTLNKRYTELLVQVLQDGIDSGEIRADLPASLLRDMIYGGIEHHAWPYLCGHGSLDIDLVAEQITGLLWQGIHTQNLQTETQRLSELAARLEQKLDATP